MTADDVMQRLASIQPLPRGERLANIAGVFKTTEARRTLLLQWAWRTNALGGRSTVAAILWSVASRALNSENESVRNIARWRAYAAPLRKAREERRATQRLFFATAAENQEMSAEVRTLRDALARYGAHEHDCVSHSRIPCGCPYCRAPCNCGLDAAMKGDSK